MMMIIMIMMMLMIVIKGADVNVLNEGGCYGSSLHYSVYKDDLEFTK